VQAAQPVINGNSLIPQSGGDRCVSLARSLFSLTHAHTYTHTLIERGGEREGEREGERKRERERESERARERERESVCVCEKRERERQYRCRTQPVIDGNPLRRCPLALCVALPLGVWGLGFRV
jgi:hypothetical protein